GWFQDAMYLWQRWIGKMERNVFTLLSVLVGGGIALTALLYRGRVAARDLQVSVFGMACAWMMAFGPATEGLTYVLLTPAAAVAAVRAWAGGMSRLARLVAAVAYGLLALAELQLLFPFHRPLHQIGAQPLAALLLLLVFARWGQADSPAKEAPEA